MAAIQNYAKPYTICFIRTILSLHFCIVSAIFLTGGVDYKEAIGERLVQCNVVTTVL